MKKALIIGIAGQDGTLLADFLLKKGYQVFGTSRDKDLSEFKGLTSLGIKDQIKLFSLSLNDYRSVLQVISEIAPDEIYNLGGQTSVGLSFLQPVETLESIIDGTLNILEALRFLKIKAKFYNASSSECFGSTLTPATESTQFIPLSPYAVAKASSFWLVNNYRKAYNLFACSGILSNHESKLRHARFITKKITDSAYNISTGKQDFFEVGDISIIRDWGWAPDYIEAMYLILQHDIPDDFIIATGKSISLQEFIEYTFNKFGLDYRKHIKINETFKRPSDIKSCILNPEKALVKLGWSAKHNVFDVIDLLLETPAK